MRTYVLDTNACVDALNGDRKVLAKVLSKSPAALFVSVISEAELRLGPAKSTPAARSLAALNAFLDPVTILDFTSDDARAYAELRARLEKSGKPIGALDMLIAAQAVARGHWLVTDNEREFRRVAGLDVENWAD